MMFQYLCENIMYSIVDVTIMYSIVDVTIICPRDIPLQNSEILSTVSSNPELIFWCTSLGKMLCFHGSMSTLGSCTHPGRHHPPHTLWETITLDRHLPRAHTLPNRELLQRMLCILLQCILALHVNSCFNWETV